MNINIIGERNSGTNYLRLLLVNNLKGIKILSYEESGWKHSFPDEKNFSHLKGSMIIFIIVRNLEEWLISMFNNPYHLNNFNNFEKFISRKIEPVGIYLEEKDFGKNIFEIRYYKYLKYKEIFEKYNCVMLNLSYLQNNEKEVLEKVSEKFNLKLNDTFSGVEKHTRTKEINIKNKKYDQNFINDKLINRYKNIKIENEINDLKIIFSNKIKIYLKMEMPDELVSEYTLDGKIGVEKWYFNNCHNHPDHAYDQYYTKEEIERLKLKAHKKEGGNYPDTDVFLHKIMFKYVKDKDVLIIGSTRPWYEAMCLAYGCKSCTVVEYQQRHSTHEGIRYITINQFSSEDTRYDVCLSISSIEHDGLGRYGDPLDPRGDIKDMEKALMYVKKDGFMILAIPVGKDKVVWNAHRIYGRVRLPMLFEKWNIVETVGIKQDYLNDKNIDKDTGKDGGYQPVFILKIK